MYMYIQWCLEFTCTHVHVYVHELLSYTLLCGRADSRVLGMLQDTSEGHNQSNNGGRKRKERGGEREGESDQRTNG